MVVVIENILKSISFTIFSTGSFIPASNVKVINHPNYDEDDGFCVNVRNDIAVLEVRIITIIITTTTPIQYPQFIRTIPMFSLMILI